MLLIEVKLKAVPFAPQLHVVNGGRSWARLVDSRERRAGRPASVEGVRGPGIDGCPLVSASEEVSGVKWPGIGSRSTFLVCCPLAPPRWEPEISKW
jgi:hypothetical protein